MEDLSAQRAAENVEWTVQVFEVPSEEDERAEEVVEATGGRDADAFLREVYSDSYADSDPESLLPEETQRARVRLEKSPAP